MVLGELIVLVFFFSTSACQLDISCYPVQPYKMLCTHIGAAIASWEVRAQNGYRNHLTFPSSDSVGKIRSATIGSITAEAEKIAGNASFVTLSIVIMQSVDSLISLSCNGRKVTFEHNNEFHRYVRRLNLQLQGENDGVYDFTADWESQGNNFYLVSIDPSPPTGAQHRHTHGAGTTVSLRNNTIYNISISTCPNTMDAYIFNIGRCPFFPVSEVNISYTSFSNGTFTMSMRCTDGRTLMVECGVSGQWLLNTVCNQANEITTIADQIIIKKLSTSADNVTKNMIENNTTTPENETVTVASSKYNITTLVIISGAAVGLALLIGMVTFILGLLCGMRINRRRPTTLLEERSMDAMNPVFKNDQIYAEINCDSLNETKQYEELMTMKLPHSIGCDNNIAYGNLRKI